MNVMAWEKDNPGYVLWFFECSERYAQLIEALEQAHGPQRRSFNPGRKTFWLLCEKGGGYKRLEEDDNIFFNNNI